MRQVQKQLNYYLEVLKGREEYTSLLDQAQAIDKKLKSWERELVQPDQKTFQDVINFNNKINAEWMYLKEFVDAEDPEVTLGALERHEDLTLQWNEQRAALNQIIKEDFKAFEEAFKTAQVPALIFTVPNESL